MRPDGHAGLGPEGHCDMYAHLGSNVCRRRNDLLAFVQQPKSLLLLISLHEPNTKPLHVICRGRASGSFTHIPVMR